MAQAATAQARSGINCGLRIGVKSDLLRDPLRCARSAARERSTQLGQTTTARILSIQNFKLNDCRA